MKVYFGSGSKREIETLRPECEEILTEAAMDSPCDFGVISGGRNEEQQEEKVDLGHSKAHWGESEHNYRKGDKLCSPAFDVAPWVDGRFIWDMDNPWYELLSDHLVKTARKLGYNLLAGKDIIGPWDKGHHELSYKRGEK